MAHFGQQGGGPGMFPAPPEGPIDHGAYAAEGGRLDIGDLISTSARVAASNFRNFAVICAACILPCIALQMFFTLEIEEWQQGISERALSGDNDPADPFSTFGDIPWMAFVGVLVSYIIYLVLFQVAQGSLVYITIEHMAGRKAQLGDAISKGISRAPSVVIVGFLVVMMLVAVFIPTIFGVTVVAGMMGAASPFLVFVCMCPGYLLTLLLGLFVYALFAIAVPTAVVEPGGPIHALSRSLTLSEGHRLMIFLSILLLTIVVVVLGCSIGCVNLTATAASGGLDPATGMFKEPSILARIVSFLLSFIWALFFSMANAALVAVIYARLVGIRDGVDAQKLAEVFA